MNERKNKIQEIKIEIDPEIITTPNHSENVRWEDDGGHMPNVIQMIDDSQLPIKPGDTFIVKSGHLIQENERVYYLARIEALNG